MAGKTMGGDDLEGNLEFDESIPVGFSESEDSEGELQVPGVSEVGDDDPNATLNKFLNPHAQQPKSETANAKKRAKLQALRAKKKQCVQGGQLRLLSSEEQCQRLFEMYTSANASAGLHLSPLEIEDRKHAFTPSRLIQLPHARTIEHLQTQIKFLWPDWKSAISEGGCPKVLIITYSAMRAIAFTKALKGLRQGLRIAKLFSRHLKVEEQKKELLKGNCEVAVGTPNRLLKLVSVGALSLHNSSCVVVDACKDIKNTTILDMNGVREDFFKFFHSQIISNPNVRVCLY